MKNILAKILISAVLIMAPLVSFGARTDALWDYIQGGNYTKPNGSPSGTNLLIYGSDKYVNFGVVTGTNGYGFRDNSGTIQWKNSGGSWQNIGTGGTGGAQTPWTSDIDGAGFALSNAYLTATATTLDLSGVTNSLVYANGIGRLGAIATTSLGLPTFSDLSSYLTLASWYATTTDGLDEGLNNLYFTNPRVQTYLDSILKGYFWSTTSANFWDTQQQRWATTSTNYWFTQQTTDGLTQGSTNKYFANSLVDTWLGTKSLGIFWSTTSADYWKTQQTDISFSTTSADYWISLYGKGFFFSSTSADYWLTTKSLTAASSTLLSNDTNTWAQTNQFAKLTYTNATGTNATSSSLAVSNLSAGLVKALTGGSLVNAVAGVDYALPGSNSSWSTTTSTVSGRAINYSNNATDIVAIGGNATTTTKYYFDPNADKSYLAGLVWVGNQLMIGDSNVMTDYAQLAVGYNNSLTGASDQSAAIGEANSITRSLNSFTAGNLNTISGGSDFSMVLGQGNTAGSSTASSAGTNNFIAGKSNSVLNAKYSAAIGLNNTVDDPTNTTSVDASFAVGDSNEVYLLNSGAIGWFNTIKSTNTNHNDILVLGSKNKFLGDAGYVFGRNASSTCNECMTLSVGRLNSGNNLANLINGSIMIGSNSTIPSISIGRSDGANKSGLIAIGTSTPYAKFSIQHNYGSTTDLFDIATTTNASGSATTSLFRIAANGNVGIATSSPFETLSVAGNIFATGTITTVGANFTRSTTTNATTTALAISSIISKILKTGADGSVQGAIAGTDYVNGSGTSGNCVAWGASNALTDAGAPCGSGTGGSSSQWATSTLFSNMIHTAGAHGIGIGTTTPKGSLTMASSSAVEMWWNHTSASSNQKLGWISWANGVFNFGTSTDAGATTSILRLDSGTTTVYAQAISVGNGTATSSLVARAGTSTPSGGIDIPSGCYATAGVCLGTMALSGTVGQVQYYSGVNTAIGTSSLFIATSQNVGIGSTTPWAKLSIDTATALGTAPLFAVSSSSLSMFYVGADGKIGINKTNPQHRLDVNGRIAGQPEFDCMNLFLSQSNVTADQLGSATVASFACEGNMFVDVNTSNAGILALTSANVEAPMASGTPALQLLDASIATAIANNLVFLKTHVVGSATSSLGQGIAMQATIMTPKVSTATTSVTYVPLGFSDAAITSLTTTAAYALPSNGCLLVASSTPNWKLQCTKAGVVSLQDTGFATSTTAFKALLTIDSTGANVYFNNSVTSSATIPAANLPVVWLRPTVGVGLTGGVTPAQGRLGIGNLTVWGQDKY